MRGLLCILATLWLAVAAGGELVTYPEYPEPLERDYAYRVSVTQGANTRSLTVYNHTEKSVLASRTRGGDVNRRFCEFAFSGAPVRVDIQVCEDVQCYKIFPARRRLRSAFKDGVISVWLDKPAYFGVQLNDHDKTILSVFADAPENPADIPAAGAPGVLRVDGWLDAPDTDGVLPLPPEIREIYIAPGAVLNARLVITTPGTRIHGRGAILDPLSNIFRYDQTRNSVRGVVRVNAPDCAIEGVKMLDARTFCWIVGGRADRLRMRDFKTLASMMCSDGITFSGGKDVTVENGWLYVGDNALVIGGTSPLTVCDTVIGTSCSAFFPQGSFPGPVRLEDISVFRADEALISNTYNGVLRRNNKWSEMGADTARAEPGPQDLKHQTFTLDFAGLCAVDSTLFSRLFSGRNMGTRPKTLNFDGLSIPGATGESSWRAIGKVDGVTVSVEHNPAKYLITDNYTLNIRGLTLNGAPAAEIPRANIRNPGRVRVRVSPPAGESVLPAAPDRHAVNWQCPHKAYIGGALQRNWRLQKTKTPAPPAGENLVAETCPIRSVWQRFPSWMTKLEATGREGGKPVYRLVQCEKNAGMQAVVTEGFRRHGCGTYRLRFRARGQAEHPLTLIVRLLSHGPQLERRLPLPAGGAWRTLEAEFAADFGAELPELVSVAIIADTPADEIRILAPEFRRTGALPPPASKPGKSGKKSQRQTPK